MQITGNTDKEKRIKDFKSFMGNAFSFIPGGINGAVEQLDRIGFFDAPASTKYHDAYPGGLFEHSKKMAEQLLHFTVRLGLEWTDPRSPLIVGMLHDLCKCDTYKYVNVGISGHYEYCKDTLIDGHGDKSVIIAQRIMQGRLTDEEIACIRWHMGAFDDRERWNYYRYAVSQFPNVLYTHAADMLASAVYNT